MEKDLYEDLTLKQIKENAKEVEGSWNGKESGLGEDRAMIAKDIEEKVGELKGLLAELDNF